jgi:Ca2+-binding EF-hand superfamily protein
MEKSRVNQKVVEGELKRYFAQIDKENIGVITQPEFLVLIKNIGIKVTPSEEKDILKKVDPQ